MLVTPSPKDWAGEANLFRPSCEWAALLWPSLVQKGAGFSSWALPEGASGGSLTLAVGWSPSFQGSLPRPCGLPAAVKFGTASRLLRFGTSSLRYLLKDCFSRFFSVHFWAHEIHLPVPLETSGIVLYYVSVSPLELSVAGCVQKYMVHRHHAKHNTSFLMFSICWVSKVWPRDCNCYLLTWVVRAWKLF